MIFFEFCFMRFLQIPHIHVAATCFLFCASAKDLKPRICYDKYLSAHPAWFFHAYSYLIYYFLNNIFHIMTVIVERHSPLIFLRSIYRRKSFSFYGERRKYIHQWCFLQ